MDILALFKRKPKGLSTYHLRLRLLSLAEEGGREVDKLRGIIELLDGPTIVAVSEAAKDPEYRVSDELLATDDCREIKDVALYYGALKALGVGRTMFPLYLQELSRATGVEDLSELHRKSTVGATAMLLLLGKLFYFNLTVFDGVGSTVHPELVNLVLSQPHEVDEIISFLEHRTDLSLATLHPQVFLDSVNSEAQSLRDGVL